MYRLVIYVLSFYLAGAFVLSFAKVLPYSVVDILSSVVFILFVSWFIHLIFSYVYKAPVNVESVYITALILFFIISPAQGGDYSHFLMLAFWASVWSVASKYIFAIGKKHLFNPAAVAVVITAFAINESASWWVGTPSMLPFVIIGGILVIRKIRRTDLFLSFSISALATVVIFALINGGSVASTLILTLKNSAFFFFAFIMLTEPLTSPTTKWMRVAFGVLVGILSAPALHVGSIYSTPEIALIIGNIFSYIVSPKDKLILKLKNRILVATDTYDFIFEKSKQFYFKAGQYMEWTLKHRDVDSRGNRRYFTLASSPTEPEVHLGVKFYPEPSSFKNRLLALPIGEEIVASQQAGDFVLPKDKTQGLVFIAGGIGVTPFRSMIQYLIDTKEKRNITILYSNKTIQDVAYKEVFDRAEIELGIKTIHVITNNNQVPLSAPFIQGPINSNLIIREIPDFQNKVFYISGPHGMVNAFEETLKSMGVKDKNIKIDFFPGFA